MHGIVFAELQKYAETKHGARTWQQVLTKSGLASKLYFPVQEYSDSEIASLVRATSEMTGQPSPPLPYWKTLGNSLSPRCYACMDIC